MTPLPIRLALRRTLKQVRHVRPVRPRSATGLVKAVYRQVERDFGMLAPPTALHSPAPEVLAAAWTILRESLIAGRTASRAAKEAVASAVSVRNACPYCVEVHSATMAGLMSTTDAAAISEDNVDAVTDPEIRAVAAWARGDGSVELPAAQAAELIAVAFTFEYLNRVVHVFLGSSPLPPEVPENAKEFVRGMLGRFLRPSAEPVPGAALDLLPGGGEAPDWADGVLGDAFARAFTAFGKAGERALSAGVRELVEGQLREWNGESKGLSRAWVEPLVSALPEHDRAAARFALLTAFSAYQVNESIVEQVPGGDVVVVEIASWAAFSAARRAVELRGVRAGKEKTAR
ncbi:carboxymuconolactone decarboxylase family protein [Amycolatopsis sp. 195334CR]|uniref:carboxymuconolactone decarboxylase family protein n=1 Tax=Amycolatopsis sp. 195334CR TaxID=2814588 RepID=UPI001A8DD2F6|nr:carboxymuconolactone decarboxylase family protein [Amycolatopsis sp. 195334CR]MBN6036966.1 carboxymuconolactone decarboxylase family protein [Amycolatopsis sp. 195334CR]